MNFHMAQGSCCTANTAHGCPDWPLPTTTPGLTSTAAADAIIASVVDGEGFTIVAGRAVLFVGVEAIARGCVTRKRQLALPNVANTRCGGNECPSQFERERERERVRTRRVELRSPPAESEGATGIPGQYY